MRLLQFPISADKRDAVVSRLDELELDYVLVEETSAREYDSLLLVPVETEGVDTVLDDLAELDVQREGFVAISGLEAFIGGDEERRGGGDTPRRLGSASEKLSQTELRTRAREMAATTPNYVMFTVLSAVVATAGLLTDSVAVLVGSMVIAPLLGPAIGASVGRMIHDPDLFRSSVRAQVVGLVLAMISAFLFALIVRFTIGPAIELRVLEQVSERTNPGALSLVIAVASGIAGALSFTTGASAPFVGVMIAAALLPPAAAVGIGGAFGYTVLAGSAGVLVLLNLICINLAGMAVLWFRGYRPGRFHEMQIARKAAAKQAVVLIACLLLLSSFLVVTTVDVVQNASFERQVDDVVTDSEATVISHSVSYQTGLFNREPSSVTVVVTEDSPPVAETIRERIRTRTGQSVEVTIIREDRTTTG